MISLQPAAFLLLFGAAAIVVLYLLRSPRQERRIPTTALWLRLKDVSRVADRRKRTLISLAVQIAIFLLIVGAAVRPYLLEEGKSRVRTVAVLIDCSASMRIADASLSPDADDTRPRLEVAKETAYRILAGLRRRGTKEENDRALIIQVATETRIVQNITDSGDDLRRAIKSVEQTNEVADYAKAARLLAQLVKAWPELETYILSDGQLTEEARKAWRQVPGGKVEETNRNLAYVPIGGQAANVGIVNFAARRNIDAISDFEVVAEVLNSGAEPVECRLELRMSTAKEELGARTGDKATEEAMDVGVLMDVFALKIGPGEREKRVLRKGNVPLEGIVKARLKEVSGGNELLLDDSAAQLVPRTRRAKVVLITDEQEEFLLGVMRANIGSQAYRLPASDYRPNLPVDAYIFVNHLPDPLPPRNILIVNAQGRIALPKAGRSGESEIALLVSGALDAPKVRSWNRHHPVMNRVSIQNLLLDRALRITSKTAAETVARSESGPLVLAFERGRQKLVYVGFDPQDSDIVFRSSFPLVVDNCVRWFMQDEALGFQRPVRPGEPKDIALESDADSALVYLDVQNPVSLPAGDTRVRVGAVQEPGIYLYEDGGRLRAFAVNLSSALESDVATQESLGVGERTMSVDELSAAPMSDRRLWPYLAFLVPFLLVLEAFLYHRRIAF